MGSGISFGHFSTYLSQADVSSQIVRDPLRGQNIYFSEFFGEAGLFQIYFKTYLNLQDTYSSHKNFFFFKKWALVFPLVILPPT